MTKKFICGVKWVCNRADTCRTISVILRALMSVQLLLLCGVLNGGFSFLHLDTANSCWAIEVQSIILSLMLTHHHTHTHTHTHQAAVVVCVCVEEVVSSFWYGGLNQPGAQQWSYWGGRCPAWPGVDGGLWRGLGVDGCFLGGLLCVETLSPAAVAWHAPASGRTDSSRQCQVSCCGRWRGPLSSWGIWRG